MFWSSWIQQLQQNLIPAAARGRAKPVRRRHAQRLRLEELEPRSLLSLMWSSCGDLGFIGGSIGANVTPNGHFFASDGFGLKRSVDQCSTWQRVPSADGAGGAIAYAPSNPNIMIAGRGGGTLKSVDGGANWFKLPDLNGGGPPPAITFQRDNDHTVYAGFSFGWGLYKSTNGGGTWTQPDYPPQEWAVSAVAIDPSDPRVLYVGTHPYSLTPGAFKSIDGGINWTTVLRDVVVNSIIVDPANPQRIYVGTRTGNIHKTEDGGARWSLCGTPASGTPVTALAFDPQNSSHLFAATNGRGVFRSDYRCDTWTSDSLGLIDPNIVAMAIQPEAPYRVFAVTANRTGFRATVPLSSNALTAISGSGQSTTVNTPFAAPLVARLTNPAGNPVPGVTVTFACPSTGASCTLVDGPTAITDADGRASKFVTANAVAGCPYTVTATVAGSPPTSFSLTNDPAPPAVTWNSTNLSLSGQEIGVNVTPNGYFFASDGGGIKRSRDQGSIWETVHPGDLAGGAIAYAPSNPNIMIAGRWYGTLKSEDGGSTWRPLPNLNSGRSPLAITFQRDNERTVYVGFGREDFGLYKSTDGGLTWTNPLQQRSVCAIAIDPSNPQVLYVGTRSYPPNAGAILKSTDGGSSWNTVLRNTEACSIVVDPANPQRIYAGTTTGDIHKSENGGTTWAEITGAVIVTEVSALAFDPQNSARLFAATRGEGVFYSTDSGVNWPANNQGLTDRNVVAMSIQTAAPYHVFAATYGGRGFRTTVPFTPNYVVTNVNDSGPGSLRQTLLNANSNPGRDTITFNIPGAGIKTINLVTPLETITDAAVIDGYSQPGATANTLLVGNNANLLIELNGAGAAAGTSCLTITADNTTVKGLVINRCRANAIELRTARSIVIEGNFIGTNAAGTAALPNQLDGVVLVNAPNNMIGGTVAGARNVISGNARDGVRMEGAGATGNQVQGNYIGTTAAGAEALGNGENGVRIFSANNTVGGATLPSRNVLSGNGAMGVLLDGEAATGNRIQNNRIGTDVNGDPWGWMPNYAGGIYIVLGSGNRIEGNEIAFNVGDGVTVYFGSGNTITQNRIWDNSDLGIDHYDDGVTLDNVPELYAAWSGGGMTFVQGLLMAYLPYTEYRLEFFVNSDSDPSGYGEGMAYLGTSQVWTDENGLGYFEESFNRFVPPGYCISATATDPDGTTWEFGNCVLVSAGSAPGGGSGDLLAGLQLRQVGTITFPGETVLVTPGEQSLWALDTDGKLFGEAVLTVVPGGAPGRQGGRWGTIPDWALAADVAYALTRRVERADGLWAALAEDLCYVP